ncbi:Probable indole-3-pyruvate monooxygenase YUCCA11 [Striga hermonthica]|uniref:Flavin-containing monooxygenase n=1 Tax=Striga hermonthica TaxID=68872 RepID=A0A9N7RIX3_STRHE|nr:Probable indole-3-pyruvate monooxygenase YUCCA11 [Striga hermonthica]
MPFPSSAPTYLPKHDFIQYLDEYASHFNVTPLYHRRVSCASFGDRNWLVVAENTQSGTTESYSAKFLVVATGENNEGYIPPVSGLGSFNGETMHASFYDNGNRFCGKDVLVVGSGNSGMEIAFDLSNCGSRVSIVVRSPVHYLANWMVKLGMEMLKFLSIDVVDKIVLMLSKIKYGDLNNYGIQRPSKGPFYLKVATGRSPVIDVGTIGKIQEQKIKVLPSIEKVDGDYVRFANGDTKRFDAIVFATGYKSAVREWLKDDGALFGENGIPKVEKSKLRKGENGLYCAGFGMMGLIGISNDAKAISHDIVVILNQESSLFDNI